MAFQDRTLTCKDCGADFVFTVGEQEFYAEKGFENDPVRCKTCRDQRKNKSAQKTRQPKEMHTVTCAECGIETEVPFKPTNNRPVFCKNCFNR